MAPTLYHVPKTISSPIYQTLLELGVADDVVNIETLSFDDLKSDEHKKRNPMGTSPTLVDEELGIRIWESGAVLAYLLEEYDQDFHLHPQPGTGKAERARFLHIQQFITATIYPFVASWYLRRIKPQSTLNEEELDDLDKEAEVAWEKLLGKTLNDFLDENEPYFMGSELSAIDLLAAKPLGNASSMGFLKDFPKLHKLLEKVQKLPSFETAYGTGSGQGNECHRRRSMILLQTPDMVLPDPRIVPEPDSGNFPDRPKTSDDSSVDSSETGSLDPRVQT